MTNLSSTSATYQLTDKNVVIFATKAQSQQILSTADSFTRNMTSFDRSVRLKSDRTLSSEEFLRFAGSCALDWSPGEVTFITASLNDLKAGLSRYSQLLPAEILFIKTTGNEEFKSAYTRQNAIILPPNKLDRPRDRMALLIAHELFHIISRHDHVLRESLYSAIGFQPCGKIKMPSLLKDRILKNPDTPDTDYYVCLSHQGKPFYGVPLFSFKDGRCDIQHGEAILQYLEVNYLAVEPVEGGWQPLEIDGRPVLIHQREALGLAEQAGRNTNYDICADEILAENFVLLVSGKLDVPSPEILEKIGVLLRSYS